MNLCSIIKIFYWICYRRCFPLSKILRILSFLKIVGWLSSIFSREVSLICKIFPWRLRWRKVFRIKKWKWPWIIRKSCINWSGMRSKGMGCIIMITVGCQGFWLLFSSGSPSLGNDSSRLFSMKRDMPRLRRCWRSFNLKMSQGQVLTKVLLSSREIGRQSFSTS
mgnify:CR=1 FL=1